ncbi:MAG: S8 family peptidase [FCB group bacterium]|jgi:subtilisin family serine protease
MDKFAITILIFIIFIFAAIEKGFCGGLSDSSDTQTVTLEKNSSKQQINYSIKSAYVPPANRTNPDSNVYYNVIVVKTLETEQLSGDKKAFLSPVLQNLFKDIHILNIRAPYDNFNTPDFKYKDNYGLGKIYEIYYSDTISPLLLIKKITTKNSAFSKQHSALEYVCPKYKPVLALVPNDSLFPKQRELVNIEAEKAYDITKGSKKVIIAIVDTELDWQHEDLSDNIWTNPGETGLDSNGNDKRTNGIDDDGDGKIDDWHGWDFLSNTTSTEFTKGIFREDNDSKIYDVSSKFNHGTMVASCASGVTNNQKGIASIGYNCMLLPVKVGSDLGGGWRGDEGIIYAATMGADIINCSWIGLGWSDADKDVIKQANSMGSVIVAATGNSGGNIDDVQYMNDNFYSIVYVGASDSNDTPAKFSNFGINTTVFAPGAPVWCDIPYNKYSLLYGTSMSTPIVSGIAGLIRTLHPDWSPRQVYHQIRSTADRVLYNDESPLQPYYFCRANAFKAVSINDDFNSSSAVPGIEFTDFKITPNDTLNNNEDYNINLKIKNFLAPANNLDITLTPLDSFTFIPLSTQTIESIKTLEEKDINFLIRLAPGTAWYKMVSKLLVTFKCNLPGNTEKSYINVQLLKIPIKPPPLKSYSVDVNIIDSLSSMFAGNDSLIIDKINDISVPDINTLWIAGNTKNKNSYIIKVTPSGISTKKVMDFSTSNSADNIYGLDGNTAYLNISHQYEQNSLHETEDGGLNWNKIQTEKDLYFINKIGFWNKKQGFIIGWKNLSFNYNIILTGDGGKLWMMPVNLLDNLSNLQKELKLLFIGKSGCWIETIDSITLGRKLIYTNDYGNTWQDMVYRDSTITCINLFVKDEQNSIGLFNKISNFYNSFSGDYLGIASNDLSGNNDNVWSLDTTKNIKEITESSEYIYWDIYSNNLYIKGSNGKFIYSEDAGRTWLPLNLFYNKNEYSLTNCKVAMVNYGRKTRVWFAGAQVGYFDLDNMTEPPDTLKQKTQIIKFYEYFPNPSNNIVKFQIYLYKDSEVSLKIYNELGLECNTLSQFINFSKGFQIIEAPLISLSPGVYFFKIQAGDEYYVDKFIIYK